MRSLPLRVLQMRTEALGGEASVVRRVRRFADLGARWERLALLWRKGRQVEDAIVEKVLQREH